MLTESAPERRWSLKRSQTGKGWRQTPRPVGCRQPLAAASPFCRLTESGSAFACLRSSHPSGDSRFGDARG